MTARWVTRRATGQPKSGRHFDRLAAESAQHLGVVKVLVGDLSADVITAIESAEYGAEPQ